MRTPKSDAFTQWTTRSTLSNRRSGGSGLGRFRRAARSSAIVVRRSGGIVVTSVRTSDPTVDVVAAHFPVTGFHFLRQLDAVEPLARLVAVHRCDIEPHRSAVFVGQR